MKELLVDTQEHPLLQEQRKRAWEAFLGLSKSETLPKETFKKAINPGVKEALAIPEASKNSCIVFVNGWFCEELSSLSSMKRCSLLPFKEALKTFGSLIQGTFTKRVPFEKSHMALLNYAMHQAGAFVYIPPKSVFQEPLYILSIICADTCQWIMPKLQLFIGAHSDVKIQRATKYISGTDCLYNAHMDITVEEHASVQIASDDFETKGCSHWFFDTIRAQVKSHASFSTIQMATELSGSYDVALSLVGEEASCFVGGLMLLSKEVCVSTKVLVDHMAPSCRSMQLFKNILTDTSEADFSGKILVRQKAQKTESYQLNRSLLLSDLATSKSSPNLEIFADDVKASHGSTCGQLDVEELFYLTSRGIKIEDARRMLFAGFCEEIIKKSFSSLQKERLYTHLLSL
jgi:Fe-S cluster assembly protein SufD